MSEQDDASEKREVRCPNVQALFDKYRPFRTVASLAREYGVSEDKLKRYRKNGRGAFTRPPGRDITEIYARVLDCPEHEVVVAFVLDFYPVIEAESAERANELLAIVSKYTSPVQMEELIQRAQEILARGSGESRAVAPRI